MSEEIQNKQDEMAILKARATKLGIPFSNNIGLETLREKINNVLESKETTFEETTDRVKMFKENMRLIRCRITNLNPAKKDLPGEIFTIANEYLGVVRKFIPYNEAGNAYHIPYIIYKELKNRKYNQISVKKIPGTNKQEIIQKWVPEFSLEILDPLNKDDLARLAAAQKAGHHIDDNSGLSY